MTTYELHFSSDVRKQLFDVVSNQYNKFISTIQSVMEEKVNWGSRETSVAN